MKKMLAASGAAFVLLAAILFVPFKVGATSTYTTIYRTWMQGSKIDSTPIGQTTAAAGSFTSLSSDLTGVGGAKCYTSNDPGSNSLSLECTTADGITPAQKFVISGPKIGGVLYGLNEIDLDATSLYWSGTAYGALQGNVTGNLTGNASGNAGTATATQNTPSVCGSGFFSTGIASNFGAICSAVSWAYVTGIPSLVNTFNGRSGTVTLQTSDVNGVGTISNNTTGNAATATALAALPSQCAAGAYATGVAASGSANCTSFPAFSGGSGYQVLQSGLILEWGETSNFDTGPVTVTFPFAFPHACLMPPQLTDNSDISITTRIWESGSCTSTGFTARNNGSGQAHYFAIGY